MDKFIPHKVELSWPKIEIINPLTSNCKTNPDRPHPMNTSNKNEDEKEKKKKSHLGKFIH